MRHTYSHNFNGWRAVGLTGCGEQHLLYMGTSQEQVKKNFPGSFYEILTPDEQHDMIRIVLEKWNGAPDRGFWSTHESLKIPRIHRNVG